MAKNRYNIKYSTRFSIDLENILYYITYELKNKKAAEKLVNNISGAIINRSKAPESYEKYKTKSGNIYYRIYINNYIVFYTVSDNIMEVRRIIYSRRNIDEILKNK